MSPSPMDWSPATRKSGPKSMSIDEKSKSAKASSHKQSKKPSTASKPTSASKKASQHKATEHASKNASPQLTIQTATQKLFAFYKRKIDDAQGTVILKQAYLIFHPDKVPADIQRFAEKNEPLRKYINYVFESVIDRIKRRGPASDSDIVSILQLHFRTLRNM